MKLYSYWRSTTSYRVRAALNLKGIEYEILPIDLVAGDQRSREYETLNPSHGVPALVLDDGTLLSQSLAIIDYLDAKWPSPKLIPQDPLERAKTLGIAHIVALDIHPVNNLRVIGQLKQRFDASADDCQDWMHYWMVDAFTAIEKILPESTSFAFGDMPNIADLCIVAQVYNARRWDVDLTPFPAISRIEKQCLDVPEIMAAHPDKQSDAKEVS